MLMASGWDEPVLNHRCWLFEAPLNENDIKTLFLGLQRETHLYQATILR
jgi:hypothetical protein